jgi:hypothetical protein
VTRSETAFAIVLGLLVNECCELSPWVAVRLVRWAARLRYSDTPERAAIRGEELTALVNDRPGKLFKLLTALGFTLRALTTTALRTAPRKLRRLAASARRFAKPIRDAGVHVVCIGVLGATAGACWTSATGATGVASPQAVAWGAVGAAAAIGAMLLAWNIGLRVVTWVVTGIVAGIVTWVVAQAVAGAMAGVGAVAGCVAVGVVMGLGVICRVLEDRVSKKTPDLTKPGS